MLNHCTESIQAILHAEYALVFLVDVSRNELWTQWKVHAGEEVTCIRWVGGPGGGGSLHQVCVVVCGRGGGDLRQVAGEEVTCRRQVPYRLPAPLHPASHP